MTPKLCQQQFIPLSYIEHVKHEAYVQKRKYLCSVIAAIEKNINTHTHSHTHSDPMQWVLLLRVTNATKFVIQLDIQMPFLLLKTVN